MYKYERYFCDDCYFEIKDVSKMEKVRKRPEEVFPIHGPWEQENRFFHFHKNPAEGHNCYEKWKQTKQAAA